MSRYGKYFLQHLLCLEDAFCHYYVQDDSWGRQEILDVEYVIFDWDEDAEAWLVQCAEHDPYTTMNRLRTLLAEDCLTQYQVHRMNDRQVVLSAARELSMNAYRMVIEPKIGWAVRVDPATDEPVQPIAVEAAPDMDDMLDELRVELDGLVEEQKKNYRQWEAKLAGMSDAEKAALYGKKAGGGLYNATIGSLVDLVKAAPGFAKKAASAWWKFKTYPLRLARITAQAIKTGSMDPLQKEIKAKLGPVVRGAKQLRHFTSMTMVLLGEETTRDMLLDFVDRYWDNTHPLEKTELGAEAASEVVINILLAIFTAGVGVAANVAAKSGRLIKVAMMLERVAGSLKRMNSLSRLPKKRKGVGKKGLKSKAKASSKGKGPEQPRTPDKKPGVDDDKKKDYSKKGENDGPKTTPKKKIEPGGHSDRYGKFKAKSDVPPKYSKDERFDSLSSDPDQGGKISSKTRQEAMAGLEAESQGLLKKPIERGPKGIEFYDGDGMPYDVKAPPSPPANARWPFNAKDSGNSIVKELRKPDYPNKITGELEKRKVILDSTYMNKADHKALWNHIKKNSSKEELNRIIEINTDI